MANNNAVCELFCSPLEPTGHYTIDSTVRESMLANPDYSASDFTFLPRENIIKYPANAGTLECAGINYLRYKNRDFGDRWIYCFVRSIEYAAPETAILHIERDAWVTWCDVVDLGQAFIERERIPKSFDDNNIGSYLLPEPVDITGYRCDAGKYYYPYEYNGATQFAVGIVVGLFNIKSDDNPTNKNAKQSFNSHANMYLDGVYYGGMIVGVEVAALADMMQCISVLGGEVAALFPIPLTTLYYAGGATTVTFDNDGTTKQFDVYYVGNPSEKIDFKPSKTRNDNPWTFTVNNKKLYSYPYMMLQASNCAGIKSEYRYEIFGQDDPSFTVKLVLGAAPSIVLVPNYYEGRDKNLDTSISNNNIPPVPFINNAYATYMGQSSSALMMSKFTRAMDVVGSVGGGLQSYDVANMHHRQDEKKAAGEITNPFAGVMSAAKSEVTQDAMLRDLRGLGNVVTNVPSANVNAAMGQLAVAVYRRFVLESDAKRIDDFFSRYGYRVDRVGVPNISQRDDYDYIKTRGANVGGAIPVSDKAVINALLDSGLTIWHSGGTYGAFQHH